MTGCTNGTTSVVYAYDALGRKVKRIKGSPNDPYNMQTTRYIYDGLDCIMMLHEDYGGVCPEWVLRGLGVAPGIGNVVATQLGSTTPRYYHPNHRGDTVFITNSQGVKDASLVYDAFGRLIAQSGNVDRMEGVSASYMTAVKFRFSSKEWDPDAQLYYFGFRWYDPDSGTWTTKDPLSFNGGDMNTCRFVANRATMLVDCYGLVFWSAVGSVVGKVWNAPNTLMGATLGAIGTAFGGDMPTIGNNAIQFNNSIFAYAAFALGNVIFYNGDCDYSPSEIGPNEQQHTLQGEVLGPLYLPAHLTLGTASMIINGDFSNDGWHKGNPLEYGPHENNPPTMF
jgi:RHS repeat-associated protein